MAEPTADPDQGTSPQTEDHLGEARSGTRSTRPKSTGRPGLGRCVRRRRARPRQPGGDAPGPQAHPRGREGPGRRDPPAPRADQEARRDDHRDRRLRHGQPGQVVGPQRAARPRRLRGRRHPRHHDHPLGPAVGAGGQGTGRPGPGPADPRRHAGHRRGRRRGPRDPGPRGRPHRRPDPLHRLRRHAAQGGRRRSRSCVRIRSRSSSCSTRSTAIPRPTGNRSTPSSRTSGSRA